MRMKQLLTLMIAGTVFWTASLLAAPNEKFLATPWLTEDFMSLEPTIEVQAFDLKIQAPNGESFEFRFDGRDIPYVEIADLGSGVDGLYFFELVASPLLSNEARTWLKAQRDSMTSVSIEALREKGFIGDTPLIMSGKFRVSNGAIWIPNTELEEKFIADKKRTDLTDEKPVETGGILVNESVVEDLDDPDRAQVFATDVVVQGSLCTGFDCVNGESFGSDTLRLKENNLRIHFNDTSNSGSFPTADWRIVANDQTNGGANYLAFEDSDAGTYPFRVLQGAGNNAIYVDAQGDVGLNTSNPVVELHISDGDSPTVRLEQNGSSGWQAQTWDVAGNETNFFIRDVTNGSELPFKIRPGADDNTLYLDTDSQVGIGTSSVDAKFKIRTTTNESLMYVENARAGVTNNNSVPFYITSESLVGIGTTAPEDDFHLKTEGAHFIVEDSTGSIFDRNNLTLRNTGGSRFEFQNTNLNKTWQMSNPHNRDYFQWTLIGSGAVEMTLDENGDLEVLRNITAGGTVTGSSDRNIKENFSAIDANDILNKVANIEITEWNYIEDEDNTRHIGPMAQDFYSAFGVGQDDKHISMADINGVALASIKALNEKVEAKSSRIDQLEAENKRLAEQNEALAEKLDRIEALLKKLGK